MDTQKTTVCNCRSKQWTTAFGWTQIIIFTFATLFLSVIACIYSQNEVDLGTRMENRFPTPDFWVLLLYCTLEIFLGVAVLIGNSKNNPSLLLLWTNARCVSAALVFVGGLHKTMTGDGSPFIISLLYALLTALLICVVDHRMEDVVATVTHTRGEA